MLDLFVSTAIMIHINNFQQMFDLHVISTANIGTPIYTVEAMYVKGNLGHRCHAV